MYANSTTDSYMNIVKEFHVAMSDGVKIYTYVQLPSETGTFPIIFRRNPYVGKEINMTDLQKEDTHGYAIVTQHCRGCGRSEGDCIPYVNERQDGLDSLEWIRQQPFYQGEIYPVGGSYLTSVHYAYLDTHQPDIKGAVLGIQDPIRYNVTYRNGFMKCGLHGQWAVGMYKKNSIFKKNYVLDTFRTMPLLGVTRSIFGEYAEALEAYMEHPLPDDPFWQTLEGGADSHNAVSTLNIPTLFYSSFYDIYTEGIFDMWETIPAAIRPKCALLVTPYNHNPNPDNFSPVVFPNGGLNENFGSDFVYQWLDHVRTGAPLRTIPEGKTTYYTLWENQWHTVDSLKEGQKEHVLYLNDHTLDATPQAAAAISYTYNPYAPASFKGGLCNNFGGMAEQDKPNSRYDIVSFLSAPFEAPCKVEGRMKATLHVRSSCLDTCFYIRTSIVKNDVAYGLRDDITSISFQHPHYNPNETVELEFTLGHHSFLFEAGDRLRLDVSSSAYPLFHPHTNRKGLQAAQNGADIAVNTIVTGPSNIRFYESN